MRSRRSAAAAGTRLPTSRWERCAHPQTDSPLQTSSRALCVARCSVELEQSALLCVRGTVCMRVHAGLLRQCALVPAAGPAWPASRQRQRVSASSGRAWPVQPRRGAPGTAALRTHQPRPQLELRARQRGRVHPPGATRTSLGWSSAGAPEATRPPRRRALLNSVSQRPCGCWLSARAAAATRRRAACVTARRPGMMWTCRMARTPPARSTALPRPTTLLATACTQVAHAACPRLCFCCQSAAKP